MYKNNVSEFVRLLMNSRNQAHVFHLTTKSYAQHKALQKYYEGIVPLLDSYAETYMGAYGNFKNVKSNKRYLVDPKNVKKYFRMLMTRINKLKLPKDSELRNILDSVKELIRGTMYKLTLK